MTRTSIVGNFFSLNDEMLEEDGKSDITRSSTVLPFGLLDIQRVFVRHNVPLGTVHAYRHEGDPKGE